MIPVKSFFSHFKILKTVNGWRNTYNRSHHRLYYKITSIFLWFLLIPLKILDLIGFYHLIDLLRRLVIKKRKLTPYEIKEAQLVFGEAIDLTKVRISENSFFAKLGAKSVKKSNIGFVLFRTINFSRKLNHSNGILDTSWLIHELVHVLQFKHLGVQYIFEALRAQRFGGYYYGGLNQLQKSSKLNEFNLEQQADIIKNYYRALKTNSKDVIYYEPYISDMKKGAF